MPPAPRTARVAGALVVVASLLAAAGCAGDEDPAGPDAAGITAPPATDPAPEFPVARDPAEVVYAALGQRFGLALEVASGAGLRWQLAETPDPAVLVALGSDLLRTGEGDDAPLLQIFAFAGAAEGEATVTLRLVAADGTPVEAEPVTFEVVVTFDGQPPPEPDPELDDTASTTTTTR